MFKSYLYLFGAIIFEVIGTTMLKVSDGFTKLMPTLIVLVCFTLAFILLVMALENLPLSLAYSIWAGLGTAGAGVAGVLFFDEVLSMVNIMGIVIIIGGVVVMNFAKNDKNLEVVKKTS